MAPNAAARSRLVNVGLYQAGWFLAVLGGSRADWPVWTGLAAATVLAHLLLVRRPRAELALLLFAGLFGSVLESGQIRWRAVAFVTPGWDPLWPPPWIVILWMQFATLFRFSLAWLGDRLALAAVLGAVGGPVAFLIGRRLGAVVFPSSNAWSLTSLAIVWLLAVPLLAMLARRAGRGAYRWE